MEDVPRGRRHAWTVDRVLEQEGLAGRHHRSQDALAERDPGRRLGPVDPSPARPQDESVALHEANGDRFGTEKPSAQLGGPDEKRVSGFGS
jgi:hypothetical protein